MTPPPPCQAVHGNFHPKKILVAGIYKYVRTYSFPIQTPNQSLKQWETTTSGYKAAATNLQATNQNTKFLCFEFLGLVERLSDTIFFPNLHHF